MSFPHMSVTPEWTPELREDLDRLLLVGQQCILEQEFCLLQQDLRSLLLAKGRDSRHSPGSPGIILYDGFKPSRRMHIAQGVLIFKAMNVNKYISRNQCNVCLLDRRLVCPHE